MSKTHHHRGRSHVGEDYGSKHNCNRNYALSYGKYGREVLHSELRMEDKTVVDNELKDLEKYFSEDEETDQNLNI